MSCIVFSSTYNKSGKVDALAKSINNSLNNLNVNSTYINICQLELPICDGYTCYKDSKVINLQQQTKQADGFIFCSPIYNYDVNAICKNLIELCGQSFIDKPIGVAVVAGGTRSYMAPLSFINSLMIDFRCLVIPRFIYATNADFNKKNEIINQDISDRIITLSSAYKKLENV